MQGNRIGLAAGGGRGPWKQRLRRFFLNSPNNQVGLTGSAANRFGRNGFANYRKPDGDGTAAQASPLAAAHYIRKPTRHRRRETDSEIEGLVCLRP